MLSKVARHVVRPWQLCAAVLPSFQSQPLVSTYGSWQSEDFVQTLGNCVLQLVSCIPGGVLCFMCRGALTQDFFFFFFSGPWVAMGIPWAAPRTTDTLKQRRPFMSVLAHLQKFGFQATFPHTCLGSLKVMVVNNGRC